MNSDERASWLAWRRNGLGGSDIAAVLGVSPWTSRYALWADKAGLLPESDEQSEQMEFGLMAEPMLGAYVHKRTGLYVVGEQTLCARADAPWMRCSLDGNVVEAPTDENALFVFEGKTTTDPPKAWEDPDHPYRDIAEIRYHHRVPLNYAAQATWTSVVTSEPTVLFGVMHAAFGRHQFRMYAFTPDEVDKTLVVDAATKFWTEHCVTGIPPEVDGSDSTTAALTAIYPGDPVLDAVEADSELRIECVRINALKDRIKEAEASLVEAENAVRAALGDHTILVHGADLKGKPIVLATWKPSERRTIDSGALRAAEPAIAERFTKTTETRTLLVKTKKAA